MKIIAITQARFGSTRFPGKILKQVNGKSLLELHLQRALGSRKINELIVATTTEKEADAIVSIAQRKGLKFYRGSLTDVLDRYYQAAVKEKPDYVVRITSDCPLIDPELMDEVIEQCVAGNYDYCSNTIDPTFPDGTDVEVFTFDALQRAWKEAALPSDREHVTSYIWKNSTEKNRNMFKGHNVTNKSDCAKYRLTVDEPADLSLISTLVEKLGDNKGWADYVNYLEKNPGVFEINAHIKRNEQFMKSIEKEKIKLRNITNFKKSDEYRAAIHQLIPGGAHTYSKGDDQFPALSPAAIDYGQGSHVWDIDGNEFLDCSMGLTSVSLGHAYEPIIKRVAEELKKGVNFQRPSVIEREIAEQFLALVPQHDMIKIAKNGSIVTTAAVKLARAFTGRNLVAFPGDHPFYSYDDWFIGKTGCNKGVPDEISALSVTFRSCSIESLQELFQQYPGQIACVIMEPERTTNQLGGYGEEAAGYLREAIALVQKEGALFIVDEMITGFKTAFPGSFVKFGLEPDMATWGKGIANGFSFCALTGKKSVMELGGITRKGEEKVFLISTTHGGETHAIAAALATIEEFNNKNVVGHNHQMGNLLIKLCKEVIQTQSLQEYIEIIPCNWMPAFVFKNAKKETCPGMRTLMLQEMIRRGVLFQGVFVPCFSHTENDVLYFSQAFEESLSVYKNALEKGYQQYLIGEPAKPVFRKYL